MTRRSGAPAGHGTHREAIDALRLVLLAQQQLSTTTEKKKNFLSLNLEVLADGRAPAVVRVWRVSPRYAEPLIAQ